jgi:hypothetical protein
LLSIWGLGEGWGVAFVCAEFEPRERISRVRVVRARAWGRVIGGGYQWGIGIGFFINH